MSNIEDLKTRYREESNENLYDIYLNIKDYSADAKEALTVILQEKGGLEKIKLILDKKQDKRFEKIRLEKQIIEFHKEGMEVDEITLSLKPILLSQNELQQLVKQKVNSIEKDASVKSINPRTIIGGVLGAIVGGTIGGILWGLHMMYSNKMVLFFIFGLVLISYAIIKWTTKQSKKNIAVLILTILSVIYALLLGEILYSIFGYLG